MSIDSPDFERFDTRSFKLLNGIEQSSLRMRQILSFLFIAFLFYVFTDGQVFHQREISDLADIVETSDQGDSVRQLFYVSLAAFFFFVTVRHGASALFRPFPISLVMLVVWCFISSSWAIVPAVSFRRIVLATIVIFATVEIVNLLGINATTNLMYKVLTTLLLINWLTVVAVPSLAIHSQMELDTALVGAWHGIMPHKNIASAVTALSCVFFGYRAIMKRSVVHFVLLILAIGFLIGTRGKTSLGFVLPCIFASVAYNYSYSLKDRKFITFLMLTVSVVLLSLLVIVFENTIQDVFSNPESFTGRVSIWEIVMRYADQNLFTGAGFGSFWMIGNSSPILTIGGDMPWLFGIAHSHNGYLEMLVTTGLIGLTLTIYTLVVLPFYRFYVGSKANREINGLYFGIWMFSVLYNLLETHIMNRDRQVWVIMLIAVEVCFLLHQGGKQAKPGEVRGG